MVDVSSFTPVEALTIVYCRASRVQGLTWRQVGHENLFDWPPKLPVQRYAKAWDRAISRHGGLTFTRFRERARQIAAEVLSLAEHVVVVHDFQTLLNLAESLERYVVVPVDDDDWISPHVGQVLSRVRENDCPRMVCWPDIVWWFDPCDDGGFVERFNLQACDSHITAVGSNSYAFTDRAFREWPLKRLKTFLNEHWKVQVSEAKILDEQLSIEVKHAASTAVLLAQTGNDYWWTRKSADYQPPLWAKEHCDKVREVHAQLKQDMGGTFDWNRLIRETAV